MSHNKKIKPLILGFCSSSSGSGKTTLLEKIIPMLKLNGLVISVVKHAHHNFDIDTPGKDSYRLRKSGGYQTLVLNPERSVLITEDHKNKSDIDCMIEQMDQHVDMILIEGLKTLPYKKIEVFRKGISKEKLYTSNKSIIAIATDTNDKEMITSLHINNPKEVCKFILNLIK